MKDRDLISLFREKRDWEDHLDWDFAQRFFGDRYIVIIDPSNGAILGRVNSLEELDIEAPKILNKLFEEIVLSETK